ncbi:MAG: hypothetical protein ACR2GN_00860 [Bacteroidia bacterium]
MRKFKNIIILFFSIILLNTVSFDASAQCAMCKSVTASNMKNEDSKIGRGLNTGILYLMSFPYILAAIGGIIWYTHKRKATADQ